WGGGARAARGAGTSRDRAGDAGAHPRRWNRALALAGPDGGPTAEVDPLAGELAARGARPMSGDRTEEPTPRRLRQARERGQVPRSRLFSGSFVLAAGSAGAALGGGAAGGELRAWTDPPIGHGCSDPVAR